MLLLLALIFLRGFSVDMLFFSAVVGILFKLMALLAIILFFSTCVSPLIAMFLTIMAYIIGHSGYVVLDYAFHTQSGFAYGFARFLLAVFPNLESLNFKDYVGTDATILLSSILLAFLLATVYI